MQVLGLNLRVLTDAHLDLGLQFYIAPFFRRSEIVAEEMPTSCSTSSVCSPRAGGPRRMDGLDLLNLTGMPIQ